jgi:hypothetical protein
VRASRRPARRVGPPARRASPVRASRSVPFRVAGALTVWTLAAFIGAGRTGVRCAESLHDHRCQRRDGHAGVHVVEAGRVRLRWRDGAVPSDDWLLDAFEP